jgi:hypothetical protein
MKANPDNINCCAGTCGDEICVTQADGYYAQCVKCDSDDFNNACGYWTDAFKEAALKACNITSCDPPLSYYAATDPTNYKCAANNDCNGSNVCLEGKTQSVCFDCSKVDTDCPQYWNDDTLLKSISDKCGKSCKFNKECSNNPLTTDKCNNHSKKCRSRAQQDSDTKFWRQCEPVDSNQKPCRPNSNAGWCDPKNNSMWAP